MAEQDVLFVLFGFKITLPLAITLAGGTFGAILGLYRLIERWLTRNARRLDMLRLYLDKEEKDISGRRPIVLESIRMSEHSFLSGKKFDVGAEIDQAIDLLDRGYPQAASGKLAELEKRIETNEAMLRRRADDLKRHSTSVHIFLAALADRVNKPDIGLGYIAKALAQDQSDLDALKYQSLLQLNNGDLDGAERSFDRLRQRSNGSHNAGYRADAHLGLGTVHMRRGLDHYDDAMRSLGTALQNAVSLPASKHEHYMIAQIHRLQGDLCKAPGWSGADPSNARTRACYQKALNALNQIPSKRKRIESEIKEIQSGIDQLSPPQ